MTESLPHIEKYVGTRQNLHLMIQNGYIKPDFLYEAGSKHVPLFRKESIVWQAKKLRQILDMVMPNTKRSELPDRVRALMDLERERRSQK
jgi:hypothetical protein